MINIIIAAIVGIAVGSAVVAFITKANVNKVRTESERQYNQMLSTAEKAHAMAIEGYEKRLKEQKEDYTNSLQDQKEAYRQSLAEQEARNKAQNDEIKKSLTESVIATTERVIDQRREQLEQKNGENMRQLLNPLKEEMGRMQQALNDSKIKTAENNHMLIGTLNEMMKQTTTMQTSAEILAGALTYKGKVQGNWGEHVLADILRDSGLRENKEFFQQESFKGSKNNTLIADVIVNTPDNARIIIDSKVSLKAYADYVSAQNADEQSEATKENYLSVVKHIDELAAKEYYKYVDGAIDKVLMFVPNEGSYVLAINYENELMRYAFSKGVVIVNPTTLMLTLELIARTWQNTRQEDNCKVIIDAACKAYDKLMTVVETFGKVQTSFEKAQKEFSTGMGQLCEGNGNLKKQFEGLKDMGVTTNKIAKPKSSNTTKAKTMEELPEEL